jgi:tRNA dimethylallyltransferase
MYDGLSIVTNKITIEEQKGVPHHLLSCVSLDKEPWHVGVFKEKAEGIIAEIRKRGKLPVLVGGTHYYTQSLLFEDSLLDIGDGEEAGEGLEVLKGSKEEIYEALKEVDPVMARRWHVNDWRRVRRSLEIYLRSGRRASEIYAEQRGRKIANKGGDIEEEGLSESPVANGEILLFWVHSEAQILKRRLDTRIEKMVEMGLLDEIKTLDNFLRQQREAGVDVDLTRGIWVSIGWKEFEPYLKALKSGTASQEELDRLYELSVEQTQASTRQYAKRQVRWIRIKMASALAAGDALDKLYLLDSSDVSRFDAAVSAPAIDITANFLGGDELPAPQGLSDLAKEFLTPHSYVEEPRDKDFQKVCETCNVTIIVEEQWSRHLQSRRHRGLAKKKLLNTFHKLPRGCQTNGMC